MKTTDRTIRTADQIEALDFDKTSGLIPVVAQDAASGAVLMVAYANAAALLATLKTGELHFWSRSRGQLWRKGESSGNTMAVSSLHIDCDADTVLAMVRPAGPACHTGEVTCFGPGAAPAASSRAIEQLDATLAARARLRPEGSYTVRLLDDTNLRLKKLGEECAELVAALATGDRERATGEAADLLYHTLVALRAEDVPAESLLAELAARSG